MFRGFLLTALGSKLGRVDSVALCGALFAVAHLSVQQFFPFCVLGIAAGAATVAAGNSVWPAIALHVAYNCTALAVAVVSKA